MLQGIARRVHVEDDVYENAVGLTTFTRSHPRVLLGGPMPAFDASQELWAPLKYESAAAPIRIASGDEALESLAISAAWAVALFVLAVVLDRAVLKSLQVQGG